MNTTVLTLVLAGLAVASLVMYLNVRWERKRAAAMLDVTQALGFAIRDERQDPLPPEVWELPLMKRGHSRSVKNVFASDSEGIPVLVFDYRFVTGSGKSRHAHRYTVAAFPVSGNGLPEFELAPETVLSRLGEAFGFQDIDVPGDDTFSKRYLLRGTDETAIPNVFDSEVRALLCGDSRWCVQSRAGAVAVFRSEGLWSPEDLPSRLVDAKRIVASLAS